MKIIYILLLALSVFSCQKSPENCHKIKPFDTLNIEKSLPFFYIKAINSQKCAIVYDAFLTFDISYPPRNIGFIKYENRAFYASLDSVHYFKFIDFTKKKSETYTIHININNLESYNFKLEVKDIIKVKDDLVYVIKINKLYDILSHKIDVVLFCSEKRGFIGSYASWSDSPKSMARPSGDILEQYIDYSSYKRVKLID